MNLYDRKPKVLDAMVNSVHVKRPLSSVHRQP